MEQEGKPGRDALAWVLVLVGLVLVGIGVYYGFRSSTVVTTAGGDKGLILCVAGCFCGLMAGIVQRTGR